MDRKHNMFEIVGERINTSRKQVQEAVRNRDAYYIRQDAKMQAEAGATYIDINGGASPENEIEDIRWLIRTIQEVVDLPLSIDSANPEVFYKTYELVKKPLLINSISLEKGRYDPMISFLKGKGCSVVALCMSDEGLPRSSNEVIDRAGMLVTGLERIGISRDRIYIDPLIQPVSTDVSKGVMAMDSVRGIHAEYPGVHTMCGLSNVSYGLPERKAVNRTFLTLLMAAGLDSVILDPLDNKLISACFTALMLLGRDPYCRNFIKAVRRGTYAP